MPPNSSLAQLLMDLWDAGYDAMPEGSGVKIPGMQRMTMEEAAKLLEEKK